MSKYWMITNRNVDDYGFGSYLSPMTYWISDGGALDNFKNWKIASAEKFKLSLIAAADDLPMILDPEKHEDQKHVSIFIHGYNNTWKDAVQRYESLSAKLFGGDDGLGLCILFSWPSDGAAIDYYPDRMDARKCAPDLSEVLNELYNWLLVKQNDAIEDRNKSCHAKTSVIAHSMGNYVLQNAMQYTWTRKNQPMLVALVNQLLMVAADVDNDLFKSGEGTDKSDGDAIANLTYRVTALYTGRDPVLGMSAGLKHFGKRRLGRSGLDCSYPIPDNVWGVDCTSLISEGANNIHSSYFEESKTLELIKLILKGVDRNDPRAQKLISQPTQLPQNS